MFLFWLEVPSILEKAAMPEWLIFCLASQVAWALVYVLDGYCVKQVFQHSWFAGVISSLCMAPIVLCSGAGAWLVEGESLQLSESLLPFLAGVLHMLGQFCYFRALRHSEAGIISAYFNMTPLLVPVGAWLLLSERLSSSNYLAIVGLAVCSVSFCLLDTNRKDRWQGLGLMAIASALEASYLLLLKHSLLLSSVGTVYVASTSGMILAGAMPLLFRLNRRVFAEQWPKLKGMLWFVAGIELVNLIAIYFAQRAIENGSVSQVAGVEATTPASCFLLSWLIWRIFGRIGDPQVVQALPQKIALTLVMAVLIWVVAQEGSMGES